MKIIYVFGNGNLSWEHFQEFYINPLRNFNFSDCEFIIGDFTGADTLMMEYLKNKSEKVTIIHMGEKSRYFTNRFRTHSGKWKKIGGFTSDAERDQYGISNCTHFLATDFNSDDKVKSGTSQNIDKCFALHKIKV